MVYETRQARVGWHQKKPAQGRAQRSRTERGVAGRRAWSDRRRPRDEEHVVKEAYERNHERYVQGCTDYKNGKWTWECVGPDGDDGGTGGTSGMSTGKILLVGAVVAATIGGLGYLYVNSADDDDS